MLSILLILVIILIYLLQNKFKKENFNQSKKYILWEDKIPFKINEIKYQKKIEYPKFIYLDNKIPETILNSKKNKDYEQEYIHIKKFLSNKKIKELCDNMYLPSKLEYLELNECTITNKGLIIKEDNFLYNSSCRLNLIKLSKSKINNIKKYNEIINLTGKWGDEYWHFLCEYLGSLTYVDVKNKMINVKSKKKYILELLNLFGIDNSYIVSNNIKCKKIIQPRPLDCGNPNNYLINKLSNKLKSKFNNKNNNIFILIKRNYSRQLKYFSKLENYCQTYCKKNNLEFYLHDDSNLPSLNTQLNYFNRAKIIIGPHGAGLGNMIVSDKKTIVIELLNPAWFNLCFYFTAIRLGLNYAGVLQDVNKIINIKNIDNILKNINLI